MFEKDKETSNENKEKVTIESINLIEMEKQRKESIIENGEWMRIEILVGKDETPFVKIENTAIRDSEVARVLLTMDIVRNDIVKLCPSAERKLKKYNAQTIIYDALKNKFEKGKEKNGEM